MKTTIALIFLVCCISYQADAQKKYYTSQGEYILSWSNYTGATTNGSNRTRFTMFPNIEIAYNIDGARTTGMYFGLSHRNIGFAWRDDTRHKRRAMALGIPLVFKIGDLENDNFLFFGGEAEFFYNYKKKDWTTNKIKIKSSEWLSDEVNIFQPSALVGYCTNSFMIKAKYYFYDFFNPAYVAPDATQPYASLASNMFYLSFAFRTKVNDGNDKKEEEKEEKKGEGFDEAHGNIMNDIYRDI